MSLDIRAALDALRTGEEAARRRAVAALGASGAREAIRPLLVAVSDDSWAVRQAASEYLAAWAPAELLPVLEHALRRGDDAAMRNAAMEIYVKMAGGAVPSLLELLHDTDEEIRLFSAVMLGGIRDARAAAPLIAALEDTDVNVRHAAAVSLGQARAAGAVPALVRALSDEPWIQFAAIGALGLIGDPAATPAVVPLLADDMLRGPALEALGRLAGREALPHLVPHLFDSDPTLRNAAIQAVVAVEQRATAAGESLDPEVQQALRRSDLVDHLLLTLADDEPQNRRTAVLTLGWLRESRAERPLIDLLGESSLQEHVTHALVSIGFQSRAAYEHGLQHLDDAVRQGTLRCLAWIAPPGAIDLVAPMIHDPSPEVRAEAVAAIGQLGDEDAGMLFFELLSDESDIIQESATRALASLPPERVLPLLVQALSSGDLSVRVRAAEGIGLLRDPRGVPSLVGQLRDPHESVRRAALRALGEIDAPESVEVLRACLCDDSSAVRQQAALSLGRRADPDAAPALLGLLDDPDPRMRFVALRALGQVRNHDAVPRVVAFLGDTSKELRFAAVEALGCIRSPAAVRPLMGMLVDADRSLRRATSESLGSIGDPQAVPPLLLALEDEHWSVRSAAAAALGRIASPKAVPALAVRLDDEDATVRRAATAALGEIGDVRAAGRLVEALRDPALQSTAAEALRRFGAAALPEMERRFAAADSELRRLMVDLAGRIDDRRVRKLLFSAIVDEAPSVRAAAAEALGDGGFMDAVRALMDLKSKDASPEVRQAAGQALKKLAPR
jgi:HEAT repeat protein